MLPAAWRLNLCPGIITTVPSEVLTGAFNLSLAGCLLIGEIFFIPEGPGVVPPVIVHLVTGFVKHLPHIWVDGRPPLPKKWTPATVVGPHQWELWQVASRDWINKDYIIKDVPGALILDPANIVYLYDSIDVFRDQSLQRVPIQWQASIYIRGRHFFLSSFLPLFFGAALWWNHSLLKIDLYPIG